MNKTIAKIIFSTAISTVVFLTSNASFAHDPSKHKVSEDAPNCEGLGELDDSLMDSDDPVMQAILAQCQHADDESSASNCTQEHAALGHCTLTEDNSKPSVDEHNHD